MAKFKATANVIFRVDGKETGFDKGLEYDMDVKQAEVLNAAGRTSHPELSPFFVRIDIGEKQAEQEEKVDK